MEMFRSFRYRNVMERHVMSLRYTLQRPILFSRFTYFGNRSFWPGICSAVRQTSKFMLRPSVCNKIYWLVWKVDKILNIDGEIIY